jgi:hypothetical protein
VARAMSGSGKDESILAFAVRLSWLFLGPLALFLIGGLILRDAYPPVSLPTIAFFGTVAVMIALRLLDIELLDGTTCSHERATLAVWRRYALSVLAVATLFWAIIHLVQWAEAPPAIGDLDWRLPRGRGALCCVVGLAH